MDLQEKKFCKQVSVSSISKLGLFALLMILSETVQAEDTKEISSEVAKVEHNQNSEKIQSLDEENHNSKDVYDGLSLEEKNEETVSGEELSDEKENEDENYRPEDTDLILETVVQGYLADDYVYAYNADNKVYIPLTQLASIIGLDYQNENNIVKINYINAKQFVFNIDLNNFTAQKGDIKIDMAESDYKYLDDTMFFSSTFLEHFLAIELKIDFMI